MMQISIKGHKKMPPIYKYRIILSSLSRLNHVTETLLFTVKLRIRKSVQYRETALTLVQTINIHETKLNFKNYIHFTEDKIVILPLPPICAMLY